MARKVHKRVSEYLDLSHGSMKNVKLVLGNGFDLACGLNSSYGAFFRASENIYENIQSWIENKTSWPIDATAWDLFFYLLSKVRAISNPDQTDWRDIETWMRITLETNQSAKHKDDIQFTFADVLLNYNDEILEQRIIHRYFIENQVNVDNTHKTYEYLLHELDRFEERFSLFLQIQESNPTYNENVKRMLEDEKLLFFAGGENDTRKIKGLVSIDTFNYTTPEYFKTIPGVKVRHINGKIGSAIFGIDSEGIPHNAPEYIFTKAYRRMVDLINGGREDFTRSCDNVVVFGHSLSEADYSYFFSIMNSLNLANYKTYATRFCIAFSDFCDNEEDNRRNRLKIVDSLLSMLDAYDSYLNPQTTRHGLIEIMETSDRIGFVKIDTSVLKHE